MPFGPTNATTIFQRALDIILAGFKWLSCLVYLDDVINSDGRRSLDRPRTRRGIAKTGEVSFLHGQRETPEASRPTRFQ